MLILVNSIGDYNVLGSTLDDAVGEAFDKTGKLLGLPYPGGPEVAKLAEKGNKLAFDLPRPMMSRPGLDFSFSGLKTQVRLLIEAENNLSYSERVSYQSDIAASFQEAVVDTLAKKCKRAISQTKAKGLLVAGGVGANNELRNRLKDLCDRHRISLHIPPIELCTDNGLMIAHVGAIRLAQANTDYAISCRPRWDLSELSKV